MTAHTPHIVPTFEDDYRVWCTCRRFAVYAPTHEAAKFAAAEHADSTTADFILPGKGGTSPIELHQAGDRIEFTIGRSTRSLSRHEALTTGEALVAWARGAVVS